MLALNCRSIPPRKFSVDIWPAIECTARIRRHPKLRTQGASELHWPCHAQRKLAMRGRNHAEGLHGGLTDAAFALPGERGIDDGPGGDLADSARRSSRICAHDVYDSGECVRFRAVMVHFLASFVLRPPALCEWV